MIQRGIERPLQRIAETGRRVLRPHMGGDYRDTQAAYTMRQRATQDLALLNA